MEQNAPALTLTIIRGSGLMLQKIKFGKFNVRPVNQSLDYLQFPSGHHAQG